MQTAPLNNDMAQGPDSGTGYWITASDGVRIRIGVWPKENAKGTVLIFPGRTEYIEKYGQAVSEFADRGYAGLVVDWRGQGLADRLISDRNAGHVVDFSDYQLDVQAILAAVDELNLPKPLYLVAHSMGGCIGLRALHTGLPVKAATFSAPMWGVQMKSHLRPVAWVLSTLLRPFALRNGYAPGTGPGSYVLEESFEANELTNDRPMFEYMQGHATIWKDLWVGGPTIHWLNRALTEMLTLHRMKSPDVPCHTFVGTAETIVHPDRITSRMKRWPNGELTIVPDAKHEIMMEVPDARNAFYDAADALFSKA